MCMETYSAQSMPQTGAAMSRYDASQSFLKERKEDDTLRGESRLNQSKDAGTAGDTHATHTHTAGSEENYTLHIHKTYMYMMCVKTMSR